MEHIKSWKLNFNSKYPIYEQIVNEFSRSLVKGTIQPGERIPSIRDMALLLQVNTNTIQRAYQEMERRQMIYTQRGTGYFVMDNEKLVPDLCKEMVQTSIKGFVQEMEALGFGAVQIVEQLQEYLKEEE